MNDIIKIADRDSISGSIGYELVDILDALPKATKQLTWAVLNLHWFDDVDTSSKLHELANRLDASPGGVVVKLDALGELTKDL